MLPNILFPYSVLLLLLVKSSLMIAILYSNAKGMIQTSGNLVGAATK